MGKNNSYSKKKHLIFFGCILFQGVYTGILMNSAGIIISAIISDCGFRTGSMSLYYTIRTLFCALSVSAASKIFSKYKADVYAAVMAFAMSTSFSLMAFFSQPCHWYISAALFGVGMTCSLTLIPIVINTCFPAHAGLLLGITMASSGLASAIFSPVCSSLIQSFGWRHTVFLMGIVSFLGTFPFILATLHIPFTENAPAGPRASTAGQIEKPQPSDCSHLLLICAFSLLAGAALVQFSNYLPVYALSLGFSANTGALMTSWVMIGNIMGKFFAGMLSDRLGAWNTLILYFSLIAVALLTLLVATGFLPVLYAASGLLGIVFGVSVVMPSLTAKTAFGLPHYIPYLNRLVSFCNIVGSVSTIAIGNLYDFTGSFSTIFMAGIVLCLLSIFSALTAKQALAGSRYANTRCQL